MWLKGRMKPGVTVGQVRAEFESMSSRLAAAYPESNAQERVTIVPSRDVRINPDVDGPILAAGLVLTGAVALVLVVACANLANLMLARAAGRRRELAIRLALGAARGRMVRQLLTESIVLALAGGLVAFPLAAALATVIARVQPPLPLDIGLSIGPDWRVLVFTFVSAVITGIIFGLIPALRASRPDLVPSLKGSVAGRADPRRRLELRDALVVVQMTVSVVLVVAGAMLTRSLTVAGKVDLGYDSDRLAVLSLALEMNGYDRERGGRFLEAARQQLTTLPQVEAVAMTSRTPMALNNNGFDVYIDGRQARSTDQPFVMDGAYIDDRYFEALELRLVAGRAIEAADRSENRRVAVVTRAMAERYWPKQDALGREFRLRWGGDPYRIVGIVADYKVDTPGERPKPYIHLPLPTQTAYADLVVRTSAPAHDLVPALARELRVLAPNLVFLNTGTVRDLADVRLFPVRAGAWLIGAFGLLALVVAAVGLYGVVGYSVSRRVREIGIRKALGAAPRELVGMVMAEGMRLVLAGGVVGAVLAALGARALSSVLFVPPFDIASFALAFGVLAAVALAANAVPARRAARVDPMVALRQE
jgi:predicted permease